MNDTQYIILIVTAVISVLSLVLGFFNYLTSLKNRRNALRERVFEAQFDFFKKINELNAAIGEQVFEMASNNQNSQAPLRRLDKLVDEYDMFINSNEILIPELIYNHLDDFINYLNQKISRIYRGESDAMEELLKEVSSIVVNINYDLIDYLGIEKLSQENVKLAKGRRVEARSISDGYKLTKRKETE